MSFIKNLIKAKKEKINITKLFIANEVDLLTKGHTKHINAETFEYICSLVYEYYLLIDYSSIHDITNIICRSYFEKEKINEKIIREKLENMYL